MDVLTKKNDKQSLKAQVKPAKQRQKIYHTLSGHLFLLVKHPFSVDDLLRYDCKTVNVTLLRSMTLLQTQQFGSRPELV